MYITNITHLLDENGNIAAEMNDSGRKMASFLAMIIDHSTAQQEEEMTDIDIRCNNHGCHGAILAEVNQSENTELLQIFAQQTFQKLVVTLQVDNCFANHAQARINSCKPFKPFQFSFRCFLLLETCRTIRGFFRNKYNSLLHNSKTRFFQAHLVFANTQSPKEKPKELEFPQINFPK